MIIFDTINSQNSKIKGILHMNLIDVDYLLNKYSEKELREYVIEEYLEYFKENLNEVKDNSLKSTDYYRRIYLRIENDEDEKILHLLKKEVEEGNIYTRKRLEEIPEEEIDIKLVELEKENPEINEKSSPELIYQYRSYVLSKYIYTEMKKAVNYIERIQQGSKTPQISKEYQRIQNNLIIIGATTIISDSDYFDPAPKVNKLTIN